MRRASTLLGTDTLIERKINDKYTDVKAVADHINDVVAVNANLALLNSVNSNATNINTVAGQIVSVITASDNIAAVGTVATNIANVNTIASNITNVQNLGAISTDLSTIAANMVYIAEVAMDLQEPISEIAVVGASIDNVNLVATHMYDVNRVAPFTTEITTISPYVLQIEATGNRINDVLNNSVHMEEIIKVSQMFLGIEFLSANAAALLDIELNMPDIVTVADNILDVNVVANDLQLAGYALIDDLGFVADAVSTAPSTGTSLLETVATGIADVTTVATNIASVVATAGSIANVNTVASNIVNMNLVATQVVPNLAEILLADDNAAIVTSLYNQFDARYLGQAIVDPTLDHLGNPLVNGALYFNTTGIPGMKVYNGAVWEYVAQAAGALLSVNNLSDLNNIVTARTNLDVYSKAETTTGVLTLTNKTLDHISNTIGANHIHYPVRNTTGVTIVAGTIVTASGTQPGTDYILVTPVTDPQTQIALGIMHASVANNGTGLCMNTGVSADMINTSGWVVGTILYPNTSGGLTDVKPTTGIYQACAVVLRSHATQGTLLVEFTEPRQTVTQIVADITAIDCGTIV
jgi:hypothetical protein